jgi:hypothetical protein
MHGPTRLVELLLLLLSWRAGQGTLQPFLELLQGGVGPCRLPQIQQGRG